MSFGHGFRSVDVPIGVPLGGYTAPVTPVPRSTPMRTRMTMAALVLGAVVYCGSATIAMPKESGDKPAAKSADTPERAQIRALDEKIRSLREQFKSQTEPLEAQLKTLRDKFEVDLKALQAQRDVLVDQGESPGLKALNDEEAAQLAALAEREKAEIEKVRDRYAEERKGIQQTFQRRRHDLQGAR